MLVASVWVAAVAGCGGHVGRDHGGQAGEASGPLGGGPASGGTSASPTGGDPGTDGGRTPGTGGTTTSGGHPGSGGEPAPGGGSPASGGMVATGGGVVGGAGAGGEPAAGAAGHPPAEFCTGATRVVVQGQTLSPPVTIAPSPLSRSCCFDYSVLLHTAPAFEPDLVVDVGVMAGDVEAGEYVQGGSEGRVTARVRYHTDLGYQPTNVSGTVRLFDDLAIDSPWEASLCLEVSDPDSPLLGTRIYVPSVRFPPISGSADAFVIRLLEDPELTAADVEDLSLDSLELASDPLFDLRAVEFVEASSGWVALNLGYYSGDRLRDQVGTVSVLGVPFVVESQGDRIFLGAFGTLASSYLPACPVVTVESIQADGFTIEPAWSGGDPLSDPRLLEALAADSRLVP